MARLALFHATNVRSCRRYRHLIGTRNTGSLTNISKEPSACLFGLHWLTFGLPSDLLWFDSGKMKQRDMGLEFDGKRWLGDIKSVSESYTFVGFSGAQYLVQKKSAICHLLGRSKYDRH